MAGLVLTSQKKAYGVMASLGKFALGWTSRYRQSNPFYKSCPYSLLTSTKRNRNRSLKQHSISELLQSCFKSEHGLSVRHYLRKLRVRSIDRIPEYEYMK